MRAQLEARPLFRYLLVLFLAVALKKHSATGVGTYRAACVAFLVLLMPPPSVHALRLKRQRCVFFTPPPVSRWEAAPEGRLCGALKPCDRYAIFCKCV